MSGTLDGSKSKLSFSGRVRKNCTKIFNLPHIGVLFMFFASICYSLNAILARVITVGAIEMSVIRVFIVYLVILPGFLGKGTQGVADIIGPRNVTPFLVLRGVTGSTSGLLLYLAVKHISPGLALSISFLEVVFVPFFGRLLLKESLTAVDIVFALISFSGVILIVKPPFLFPTSEHNTENFMGVVYAVLSALFASFSYMLLRKIGNQVSAFITTLYHAMVGSVIYICLLFITDEFELPCWTQLGLIVALTTCGLVGMLLLTVALHTERPSTISVINTSQILLVLIIQVVFLHDIPSTLSLVGSALIFSTSIGIGIRKIVNENRSK